MTRRSSNCAWSSPGKSWKTTRPWPLTTSRTDRLFIWWSGREPITARATTGNSRHNNSSSRHLIQARPRSVSGALEESRGCPTSASAPPISWRCNRECRTASCRTQSSWGLSEKISAGEGRINQVAHLGKSWTPHWRRVWCPIPKSCEAWLSRTRRCDSWWSAIPRSATCWTTPTSCARRWRWRGTRPCSRSSCATTIVPCPTSSHCQVSQLFNGDHGEFAFDNCFPSQVVRVLCNACTETSRSPC